VELHTEVSDLYSAKVSEENEGAKWCKLNDKQWRHTFCIACRCYIYGLKPNVRDFDVSLFTLQTVFDVSVLIIALCHSTLNRSSSSIDRPSWCC